MKNENKKAMWLPEEVLKFVLAVVVILILIALLYNLYSIFYHRPELEQARATLDKIVGKAKLLDEGEETEVLVTGPKGWYLIGFFKEKSLPKDCEGESCLCICEEPRIEECESKGICKDVEINKFWNPEFNIAPKNIIEAIKTGFQSKAVNYHFISFYSPPSVVYIRKEKKGLRISELKNKQPFLDGLLSKDYKGKSFRDFLKLQVAKNCFYSVDKEVEIPGEVRETTKKFIKDYFDNKIKKGTIKAGKVHISFIKGWKTFKEIEISKGIGFGSVGSSQIEVKKICSGKDFSVYIWFREYS